MTVLENLNWERIYEKIEGMGSLEMFLPIPKELKEKEISEGRDSQRWRTANACNW